MRMSLFERKIMPPDLISFEDWLQELKDLNPEIESHAEDDIECE